MVRRIPSKHLSYHRLREQLAQSGCAICLLGAREAARWLESACSEHLTDVQSRLRLRESLGFCDRHAHQMDALAPRLAVAILTEDWLRCAARDLERWASSRRARLPPAPCPVCAAVQQEEESYLRVLSDFIDDPEMRPAYEGSSGLCLRHTVGLCRRLKEPARGRVLAQERERIERLRAELSEVIRKHDYRHEQTPWGEEQTAPSRAVAKLAGEENSAPDKAP